MPQLEDRPEITTARTRSLDAAYELAAAYRAEGLEVQLGFIPDAAHPGLPLYTLYRNPPADETPAAEEEG